MFWADSQLTLVTNDTNSGTSNVYGAMIMIAAKVNVRSNHHHHHHHHHHRRRFLSLRMEMEYMSSIKVCLLLAVAGQDILTLALIKLLVNSMAESGGQSVRS